MATLWVASVQPVPVTDVPAVTVPLSIRLMSKTWMPPPPSLTA